MHVRTLDLVQLLAQLLEEFYPSFSKAGLHYELIADRESLSLEGDPELLARVFENLIGNAIKYGAEGKQLRVFEYGGTVCDRAGRKLRQGDSGGGAAPCV